MPVLLSSHRRDQGRDCVTIGLVNNMPDEAVEATERQFASLLDSASQGTQVRLSFYMLPGVPRKGPGDFRNTYSSIEDLWNGHLDGLIVTGREPLSPNLMDEPYWDSFSRLVDWAKENSHSTVWSCLAAHAAILQMDGIRRRKRDDKLFGIFDCARVSDHPLTAGTGSRFSLPHSRWNGVAEEDLSDCGYRVLTRSTETGADTFIKDHKKLFLFFQGHPEYESDTLLREYRRDVGRYFRGEAPLYPSMPQSYFDRDIVAALTLLREKAVRGEGGELFPEVSAALTEAKIENSWYASATNIYRNWLRYICAQKSLRPARSTVIADLEQVS
jgi:homoserine O-succinyltransferase/O-acetyltransferase